MVDQNCAYCVEGELRFPANRISIQLEIRSTCTRKESRKRKMFQPSPNIRLSASWHMRPGAVDMNCEQNSSGIEDLFEYPVNRER